VADLEVHPVTGVLRAVTWGRGAYEVNTDDPIGSLLSRQGKLTMLRVNDVGTGYGSPDDFLDAEVIFRLDSAPPQVFGFQLLGNSNEAAHRSMLDLLRDAFNGGAAVTVEYVRTGLRGGRVQRVIRSQEERQ